jgi:hypothetical protein
MEGSQRLADASQPSTPYGSARQQRMLLQLTLIWECLKFRPAESRP